MTETILGNRYEIVEKVGMGGMAVVYKAMDKLLNRYVAVKLLRSEFEGNEEFIRRFNIESQAAASLSHPNIVPIYDVGQSGNTQYIVMEYLEGKTLKQYITEKKGGIYWKEATDISMQICSALDHAHSKHIIHRDIKPQNIMVTKDGIIKVTDFGIARAANNVTTTMEAAGSAHYLSPEQARGGYTDQRSDIYSLGVVMYELFTGILPFDGESPVAVAMQHMQAEPPKPRSINPDIPQAIEDIILKAMSKEQRLRYDSAANMLIDLKRAYADPDAEISVKKDVDDEEKFGTRIMPPIVNINMPFSDDIQTEKPKVRRSSEDEAPVRKKVPKKSGGKKGDTIAIVVAIITILIMAVIMGVIAVKMLGGPKPGEEENRVPDLRNLSIDMIKSTLDGTGFTFSVERRENSPTVPLDSVISQEPAPEELLEEPCTIKIVVSDGPETFILDDYTGKEGSDVERTLSSEPYLFRVTISMEESDEVPSGRIIRHNPSQGASMKQGDSIKIFVSDGPDEDTVTMPDLFGMTESMARVTIERNGLVLNRVIEHQSDAQKGEVIDQSVVAGTQIERGSEIDIFISSGGSSSSEDEPDTPEPDNSDEGQERPAGGQEQPQPHQNEDGPKTSDSGL